MFLIMLNKTIYTSIITVVYSGINKNTRRKFNYRIFIFRRRKQVETASTHMCIEHYDYII